jgi:hypothetical protein
MRTLIAFIIGCITGGTVIGWLHRPEDDEGAPADVADPD